LLQQYEDATGERLLCLHKRYKSVQNFDKALSNGFIDIRKSLGIDNLTFYSARHSWATIASHDCNISEDRIARCLNHVSMNYRVTSRYIKKDWSIIDEANRKVIDLVFDKLS
jgi:integrase